jgi:hypothetical protein
LEGEARKSVCSVVGMTMARGLGGEDLNRAKLLQNPLEAAIKG